MTPRLGWLLFLVGLLAAVLVAAAQQSPGYMDADYYYAGGKLLANGVGAQEPYLWNYLNDPSELPAPAFSYWMPLPSVLAAVGLTLYPAGGFWSARICFLLLAAAVAPLTALLSAQITGSQRCATLAGLVALVPGFYMVYLPTTDVFALWMVLGASFFLVYLGGERAGFSAARGLALGALAGLLHLSRADGLLWLLAALAGLAWAVRSGKIPAAHLPALALAVVAAYAVVMAPWFARNLRVWGSLLPPGGSHALWITTYAETMHFPPQDLTGERWLAAGLTEHLAARLDALSSNLQSVLAVQGEIILLPFMAAGLWALRRSRVVVLGVLVWAGWFVMMTVIFPFAGTNGSFFHSAAGVQPLLWAAVPVGVERLALAYARWRKMTAPHNMVRFLTGLLLLTAGLLSILLTTQRLTGSNTSLGAWNAEQTHYAAIEQALVGQGAQTGDIVLAANPPGYWLASGRPAVVVPSGGAGALRGVVARFDARWLALEQNHPHELEDLYQEAVSYSWLVPAGRVGSTRLFRVLAVDLP